MKLIRLGFLIFTLPFSVTAADPDTAEWSKQYERPKCYSNDPPTGDVDLFCTRSPTAAKLIVKDESLSLVSGVVSATLTIQNTNAYPVLVEYVSVDALTEADVPRASCTETVSFAMQSGETRKTALNCALERLPSEDGTVEAVPQSASEVQEFEFFAAPNLRHVR